MKISVIHYNDSAAKYYRVYQRAPNDVKAKWAQIQGLAKGYKYAEQPDNGAGDDIVKARDIKNWPLSHYYIVGNQDNISNSNTFVRYLLVGSGLQIPNITPGANPGAKLPSNPDPGTSWIGPFPG